MMATGILYANQVSSTFTTKTTSTTYSDSKSNLVFRGTQKVRASDGAEIYLYSNGSVQMYNSNGALVTECTYEWDGGREIFFKDNGKIIYKASCSVDQQKQLTSLTISGVKYWKKS